MRVNRGRLFAGLLLVLFGILLMLGFWKFGTILGFFLFYTWILTRVTGLVINPHLANIAALVITVIVYFGVYRFAYRRNKNLGFACLIGLLVLQSAFMFESEKNRFFSITGTPLKYYTVNPITSEYMLFDREVYDLFGQKAKLVNFRVSQDIYRQQHSAQFPNTEIPFASIKNFFDVRTGKALIFYCHNSTGYHFFVHDGFDPFTGRPLSMVSSEIVELSLAEKEAEKKTARQTPGKPAAENQKNQPAKPVPQSVVAEPKPEPKPKPKHYWTYKLCFGENEYRTIKVDHPLKNGQEFKIYDHGYEVGSTHISYFDYSGTIAMMTGDEGLAMKKDTVLVLSGEPLP